MRIFQPCQVSAFEQIVTGSSCITLKFKFLLHLNLKYSKSVYGLGFCHNMEHEVMYIIFKFNVYSTLLKVLDK